MKWRLGDLELEVNVPRCLRVESLGRVRVGNPSRGSGGAFREAWLSVFWWTVWQCRWADQDRGPAECAAAAAGRARVGCLLPWLAIPYPQVGMLVVAGPSVTMYPSLRHGLLLVAFKGRRGIIRAVAPGLGHV